MDQFDNRLPGDIDPLSRIGTDLDLPPPSDEAMHAMSDMQSANLVLEKVARRTKSNREELAEYAGRVLKYVKANQPVPGSKVIYELSGKNGRNRRSVKLALGALIGDGRLVRVGDDEYSLRSG